MKLSIVIPAYNEEKRIGKTLKRYSQVFENLRKKKIMDYEILVVINNTTDNTEKIVKVCRKKNKRIRYLNLKRGGKGYAILEGFKDALKRNNNLIGFVDADMSTSAEEYSRLVRLVGKNDGVIASRYLKGAIVKPKPPISRIIASRVFNFMNRVLFQFPYRDTQCGAKTFRREALLPIIDKIGATEWAFDIDLLYQLNKKGFKILETPTVWKEMKGSKLRLGKVSLQMFLAIIRLRLINSPFVKFERIGKPFVGFLWRWVKNS